MATSVRLDPETEELVRRLRRWRGAMKSDVIREAICQLAARDLRVRGPQRPHDAAKRLIGSVNSGGLHLSKRTGGSSPPSSSIRSVSAATVLCASDGSRYSREP